MTFGIPVFILYVAFSPDFNATFIHEEKCICDKNLILKQYEYRGSGGNKHSSVIKYAFRIVDAENKVKNKITGIKSSQLLKTDQDSIPYGKQKSSKFYWDCKNRRIQLTKDKFLSF